LEDTLQAEEKIGLESDSPTDTGEIFQNEKLNLINISIAGFMTDKNNKELYSKMDKEISRPKAVCRIILGILIFLFWFFTGISPTLIYSSGIQSFIGTFSFFIRNPITFLLIAIGNIIMGIISYIYIGILWWSAFHLLWSIRWFYGYIKYRNVKKASK
jgi:hypothetical protein